MNRVISKGLLYTAGAATVIGGYLGIKGCNTSYQPAPKPTKTIVRVVEKPSDQENNLYENSYVPRKFGHKLTTNEMNQLRKLHDTTWTWEAGKWVSFPSGNYSHHDSLVPNNLLETDGYKGPKTYRAAGWKLEDIQDILLVDFRDSTRNVTQDTLNAGLMYPCASALKKISDEIGTLDTIDPNYPRITLIEAIERAYDADTPRKCFRSSFQQLEAYENTTGEKYSPENHQKHAGYIARPGRGPHGTGNALDIPMFLKDDSTVAILFQKYGFRKRLPETDPVHFEYINPNTYVDFPRPGDVSRYSEIYDRLNGAKL